MAQLPIPLQESPSAAVAVGVDVPEAYRSVALAGVKDLAAHSLAFFTVEAEQGLVLVELGYTTKAVIFLLVGWAVTWMVVLAAHQGYSVFFLYSFGLMTILRTFSSSFMSRYMAAVSFS